MSHYSLWADQATGDTPFQLRKLLGPLNASTRWTSPQSADPVHKHHHQFLRDDTHEQHMMLLLLLLLLSSSLGSCGGSRVVLGA